MNFEQRTLQFIKQHQLMAPRGRVLVGVSGGADSMALLLCLSGLRHDLGVQLHVLHFNHQFRRESLRDERFVAGWCKKLNIPLTIGHRPGGKIKHLSEDDARRMRFDFFIRTAGDLKAQSVALAHTRNDLAETVMMRLMRGSGFYGLRAILPRRDLQGVVFVRPLMGEHRADVEAYLKLKKTPFCTDTTNRRMLYERNKVRLKLLPLLSQEYNPRIIDALADLAVTAGEDYEFLSMHARNQFDKLAVVSKNTVKMDLKGIQRQPAAMMRLLFRQMAEALTGDPTVLSFEHILALESLAGQSRQGSVDLPQGLKAVKTPKFLQMLHRQASGRP